MDDTLAKEGQQEIAEVEKEEANTADDDGLLLLPAHLSNSLTALVISYGGVVVHSLNALQALTALWLEDCSFRHPFPSSLLHLDLSSVKGVLTLSNLTSLTRLSISRCGEDLRCEGLLPLLTRGHLSNLQVQRIPNFFGAWDPMWGMQDEQNKRTESKLAMLQIDDIEGFLGAPALCSFLSSSLIDLSFTGNQEKTCFTKEQDEAFQRLTSLQELRFRYCRKLQHLPAGLNKLTNLKRLRIRWCPALQSLPKEGLPSSLRELDVLCLGAVQFLALLIIPIYAKSAHEDLLCCIFLLYIVHKSGVLMLVLVGFKILCSYIWCRCACSAVRIIKWGNNRYFADLLLKLRNFLQEYLSNHLSACVKHGRWTTLEFNNAVVAGLRKVVDYSISTLIKLKKTQKRFVVIDPANFIIMKSYIRQY
ncbi:hypothetical protein TRIUR3_10097 [Triticum urartu]|uniref:Disease resistance RPP13-like protein 1 n=1 Tax=Triticum urartu TaxID=4572 RepID=M8B4D8_TRIUA|nr:hypothetical protein TRIUR3_10097 [Triticum urartu]